MSKGKDKCVAQGGQLERSGATSQFTGCDAGAFVARMWLSKSKLPQASLRPFRFLTANPGKP
jgi:hypothetical protein